MQHDKAPNALYFIILHNSLKIDKTNEYSAFTCEGNYVHLNA